MIPLRSFPLPLAALQVVVAAVAPARGNALSLEELL